MADPRWTDAQRRAITTTGASMLVSAGAGSGKTLVLAERCAYLVAAARPSCRVDQLLVVTFTEAAAAQMRERISKALRARSTAAPTDVRLRKQIELLELASISTIHAFCKRALDRHFAQAGLDPATEVMDAREAECLRRETAQAVFDRLDERSDALGKAFDAFVSTYGENRLVDQVLRLDAFLASLADRKQWVSDARTQCRPAAGGQLSKECVGLLIGHWTTELTGQVEAVAVQLDDLRRGPSVLAGHVDCLAAYDAAVVEWLRRLEGGGGAAAVDAVTEAIGAYAFPAIPRRSKKIDALPAPECAAFVAASEALCEVRKRLFRQRLRDSFGRFTTADWAEGVRRTSPHAMTFLDLTEAFSRAYRQAKDDLGVIDFSDLEHRTLELLREETNGVAQRLRDRFEHVLVDEYQDVNPIQEAILRCVSREGEDPRPDNFFVVGDVKQSIYGFRLAEPQLFLDRMKAAARGAQGEDATGSPQSSNGVPSVEVVDLVDNFRSAEPVIDGINAVFERLMAPDVSQISYDEHARLKFGRKEDGASNGGGVVEVHILDNDTRTAGAEADASDDRGEAFDWERIEREAYVVAKRIEGLVADGREYGDIVVLLRSMVPRGSVFVRTLSRMGVPAYGDVAGGFFDSLEVKDVLSLLALLDNQQQDIPLAAVLRSPLFDDPLTDSELVEIRMIGRHVPFHAAVRQYAAEGGHAGLRGRLHGVLDRLDHWRRQVRRRPLADVLWDLYEDTGYLAYVTGLSEGAQRRANLIGLHERARQFGTFGRSGLYRFLRFIDGLIDAGEELEPGRVANSSENVVRVMSIHRSKGLEFPVVFVAELGKQFNVSDASGTILFDRHLGIGIEAVDTERRVIYPTLLHRLVSEEVKSRSLAEELRVLYVAMTRAKERLLLVGTGGLGKIGELRNQYAGRDGVLPLLARRTVASMLDWVLAAVSCRNDGSVKFPGEGEAANIGQLFRIQTYDRSAMATWALDPPPQRGVAKKLEQCARLKLAPSPAPSDVAGGVVKLVKQRLTAPYPAAALTRTPAVAAASELKRRWSDTDRSEDPGAVLPASRGMDGPPDDARVAASFHVGGRLTGPAFLASAAGVDARHRGTTTHAFLEFLDLARPCDADDLRAQLESMVADGCFIESEASEIDHEAVAWFCGMPLGRRLCHAATRVLREWPFVIGVEPTRYDPSAMARDVGDTLLVRGIVDCLFDAGDGWEIVDYKTDRVEGERLIARADAYRGQLGIYAKAVETTLAAPVHRRWLVFLAAREIVEVSASARRA